MVIMLILNKKYLIISLFIVVAGMFSLKIYADKLRNEGQDEINQNKNRILGIKKIRLAQTIWPLYKFGKNIFYSNEQLEILDQSPAIIIFMKESFNNAEVDTLVQKIEHIKGVKQVKFISSKDALSIYQEKYKNSPELLDLVKGILLPASIEVYLDDFTLRKEIERIASSGIFVDVIIQAH